MGNWGLPTPLITGRGSSCRCFLLACYFFKRFTRWWFQIFFVFSTTWGNDSIRTIFFKWVETTSLPRDNQQNHAENRWLPAPEGVQNKSVNRVKQRKKQSVHGGVIQTMSPQNHGKERFSPPKTTPLKM